MTDRQSVESLAENVNELNIDSHKPQKNESFSLVDEKLESLQHIDVAEEKESLNEKNEKREEHEEEEEDEFDNKKNGNEEEDIDVDDINEDEDDDDEDGLCDEETTVDLGYIETPPHPNTLLRRYFPSKIGGKPAWLNPRDLPSISNLTCTYCNNTLKFLLQIYAPLRDIRPSLFHRTLFLFCCTNQTCIVQHNHSKPSLVLFRSQLPLLNSFYSSSPPPPLPKAKKKKKVLEVQDDESYPGVSLCEVCGMPSSSICSKCSITSYCGKDHQKRDWRLGHQQECQRLCAARDKEKKKVQEVALHTSLNCNLNIEINELSNTNSTTTTPTPSTSSNSSSSSNATTINPLPITSFPPNPVLVTLRHQSLFPSYHLVTETEYIPPAEILDDESHTAELLSAYEIASKAGEIASDEEFDGMGGSFRKKDKVYEKWRERISHNPDQVIRFERGGEPLWVQTNQCLDTKRVPACETCKSERVFEFQILPQLIYYLDKEDSETSSLPQTAANQNVVESDKVRDKTTKFGSSTDSARIDHIRQLISQGLDWGTLACYTCKNSCGEGENDNYKREYVYLQPHGEE